MPTPTDFAEQTRQAKADALAGAARTYQLQAAERLERHGRHSVEDPSRLVCLERQVAELAQRVAALEARAPAAVAPLQPPRHSHWQDAPEPAAALMASPDVAPAVTHTPQPLASLNASRQAAAERLRGAIGRTLASVAPEVLTAERVLQALRKDGFEPLPRVRTVRLHLSAMRGKTV
jgi:hypothetical protein